MSTDELLDARLQEAGLRWRLENTAIATIDLLAATATAAEPGTVVPLVPEPGRAPRRYTRLWIATAAGVAAAVAAAAVMVALGRPGNHRPAGNPDTLFGITWHLSGYTYDSAPGGPSGARGAPDNGPATLHFDALGTVWGSDGCNSISGTAKIDSGQIVFGALGGTLKACTDPQVNDMTAAVHAVLRGTVAWSVTGNDLTLSKAGVAEFTYRAAPHASTTTDPKRLIGVSWHLNTVEQLASDGTVSSSDGFGNVTLRFDGRGQATSSDGCFGNGRHVTLHAGGADFGRPGASFGCAGMRPPPPAPPIVDKVLDGSVTWYLSGQFLTITKSGVGSLGYEMSSPAPTR